MRYRDLLKLYDKKELSKEEMERVSRDIERQDSIGEYLFEKDGVFLTADAGPEGDGPRRGEQGRDGTGGEGAGSDGSGSGGPQMEVLPQEDALRFTRQVNRLIRRAFIRMGTVVGAVVLAVLLFVMFALPHIVSLFYYNPAKEVAENTSQFALDLRVYTELATPGYLRDLVRIQENGYGNYDITIFQWFSLNGKMTNVAGTIKKGDMQLYDVNQLQRPTGNAFAWYQMPGGSKDSIRELVADGAKVQSVAGNREWATESLEKLSDTETYVAYVTLDRMMPYEEFMWFVKESDYPISWCAVCTVNGIDERPEYFQAKNLGFVCDPHSSCSLEWDQEKYPNLFLWADNSTHLEWEEWDVLQKNLADESYMKTHFVSLLRYMAEQKEFLAMIEGAYGVGVEDKEAGSRYYSEAADYVEEHGLVVYGCVAIADKETILKMNEDEAVYEIYAEELR
jgi:hypothetical protein